MKKIVITGATSMIGVALVNECIKNNIEVLAIIRKNSSHLNRLPSSKFLHICECDLNDLEAIQETNGSYEVFYHFSWDHTSKENRDAPELQEKNIKYTLDAVRLAYRLGCRKFIGAGSQAEYGPVGHVITPDTPAAPDTAYGIAKYAAGKLSEKLCAQYGMIHIWGRIFSVYGRHDNEGTMLRYAIRQFAQKKPAYFSSGTQMWDYLHEKDAGKMFFLIGKYTEKSTIYCIASGKARPLKEYIFSIQDCFHFDLVCKFCPESEKGKEHGLQADISSLVKDIHYIPQIIFEEGIRDMVEYILQDK